MDVIVDFAETAGLGLMLSIPGLVVAGIVFVTLVSGAAAKLSELGLHLGEALATRLTGRRDRGHEETVTGLRISGPAGPSNTA